MKKFWQIIACSGLVLTSCLGGMAQAQDEKSDVEYYYQGEKVNLDKAVSISQNYDVVFLMNITTKNLFMKKNYHFSKRCINKIKV